MDVGIGLPNAVVGATGEQLVQFAREGEKHDFSSLGTIDPAYFSLGRDAEEHAEKGIGTYYDWLGDIRDQIVGSVATDPETVRQYASAFEEVGCDELIFFPSSADAEQPALLREALDG